MVDVALPDKPEAATWKVRDFSADDSPDRYRLLYSFGATNLQLATGLWLVTQYLCHPGQEHIKAAAGRVVGAGQIGDIRPPHRDGIHALRDAMHASRLLFTLSDSADSRAIIRKRTSRFPRFFLTNRTTKALSRHDYAPFLIHEIRPAAMSLMAATLQLRDQAIQGRNGPVSKGGDPAAIADALSAGREPNHHDIVEWLQQQDNLPRRLEFNLACYFGRELAAEGGAATGPEPAAQAVSTALGHLEKAIEPSSTAEPGLLTAKARSEPALAILRDRDGRFEALVSPPADAPPPPDRRQQLGGRGAVPEALVPDEKTRNRLTLLLDAVRDPETLEISRSAFRTPDSRSVTDIEHRLAAVDDELREGDRLLLSRLLFLPGWPR